MRVCTGVRLPIFRFFIHQVLQLTDIAQSQNLQAFETNAELFFHGTNDLNVTQRIPAWDLVGGCRFRQWKIVKLKFFQNYLSESVGNHTSFFLTGKSSVKARSRLSFRLGFPAELLINQRGGVRKTRPTVTSICITASIIARWVFAFSCSPFKSASAMTHTSSVPAAGSSTPTATTRPAKTPSTRLTMSSMSSG